MQIAVNHYGINKTDVVSKDFAVLLRFYTDHNTIIIEEQGLGTLNTFDGFDVLVSIHLTGIIISNTYSAEIQIQNGGTYKTMIRNDVSGRTITLNLTDASYYIKEFKAIMPILQTSVIDGSISVSGIIILTPITNESFV